MWRRDEEAGLIRSPGKGQNPGVKATMGRFLAQPGEICSNSQKSLRTGGKPPVVMRPLSPQMTTMGSLRKYKHCLNDMWDNHCFMKINSPSENQDSARAKIPISLLKWWRLLSSVYSENGATLSALPERGEALLGYWLKRTQMGASHIFGSDDWGKWEEWQIIDYPQVDWENKNISFHASSWTENISVEIRPFSNQF